MDRVELLLEEFRRVIGVACKNMKNDWQEFGMDPEARKFSLLHLLEAGISASISGPLEYSDDEYAHACGEIARSMGIDISRLDLTRFIVRTRAKAVEVQFPERGRFVLQGSVRYLWERVDTVRSWSRDSAFLFGVTAIDDLIQGVQPGEICVLTGSQGSMKTSLALGGVENAISRHMLVQFYSLDMDPGEIQERRMMRRLECRQSSLHQMIRAKEPCVEDAVRELNIADDDVFDLLGNRAGQTWDIDDLLEHVKSRPPHVLVIDYLTLLRRRNQSDLDSVNETMPLLKEWTQRLGLRAILLSQMSRAAKREQQAGMQGGHSKGGGIVEELAHCEVELLKDRDLDKGVGRIIATVTKNRRGPSGVSYDLEYKPESMIFTGYSTKVQRAGKNANKPLFEAISLPKSWGEAADYTCGSERVCGDD